MNDTHFSPKPTFYEISLKGLLDPRWAHRFEGFEIHYLPDGITLLSGEVLDQAALHGILRQIGDIGIQLIEVRRREQENPGN